MFLLLFVCLFIRTGDSLWNLSCPYMSDYEAKEQGLSLGGALNHSRVVSGRVSGVI